MVHITREGWRQLVQQPALLGQLSALAKRNRWAAVVRLLDEQGIEYEDDRRRSGG